MSQSLAEAKKRLRREAARLRAAAAAAAPGAAEEAAARLLAEVPVAPGAVVSGYWPMGDELDPRPAMLALSARGHRLCLPVVEAPRQPLLFRAWRPGDRLLAAAFGTSVPAPDREPLVPQLLLVPLLAFDAGGFRLGYGGGFYDRTLAALRAVGRPLAVGLAYEGQLRPDLPREATDEALDWIVTQRRARRFALRER